MKLFILIFIIYYQLFANINSNEIQIIYKVDQTIVTSVDIDKEINYLKSLNKRTNNLEISKLKSIAENSLIREIIKKNQIDKIFNVDYEKAIKSDQLEEILKKFMLGLGFQTFEDFEIYLSNNNLNINDIKKKFVIEQLWNQLIYDRYKDSIEINEEKINDKINQLIEKNSEVVSYNLSEIVFIEKTQIDNEMKLNEIINSINKIGFKDTAGIYSISDSAKLGGLVGWLDETQISRLILEEIEKIKIGEYTKVINTSGGNILLNLNDKKIIQKKIDKEIKFKELISSERNRQLNQFSLIYYKEIENKAYVEKL